MAKRYRAYEPDLFLMPPSLREWLPEDNLAYFLNDLVDDLNLSEIEAVYEDDERETVARSRLIEQGGLLIEWAGHAADRSTRDADSDRSVSARRGTARFEKARRARRAAHLLVRTF